LYNTGRTTLIFVGQDLFRLLQALEGGLALLRLLLLHVSNTLQLWCFLRKDRNALIANTLLCAALRAKGHQIEEGARWTVMLLRLSG
jgi:hypothetical protein